MSRKAAVGIHAPPSEDHRKPRPEGPIQASTFKLPQGRLKPTGGSLNHPWVLVYRGAVKQ